MALEFLSLPTWPDWLDEICLGCLYEMSRGDDEGPLTVSDLNAFLASAFEVLAARAARGFSLDRCEVANDGHFVGDPIMNCRRFSCDQHAGRLICGIHRGLVRRGVELKFVEEDRRWARPFVIWAKDGNELIARAQALASA